MWLFSTPRYNQGSTCLFCVPIPNCKVGAGALTCTNTTDSVCKFCDEGFTGDQCVPNVCPKPTSIDFPRVISHGCIGSSKVGAKCFLGCAPGYFATSQSAVGMCTSDGTTGAHFKGQNITCNACPLIIGCPLGYLRCSNKNNSICVYNTTDKCQAPNIHPPYSIVSGCSNDSSLGSKCSLGCNNSGYYASGLTSGICAKIPKQEFSRPRFQGQGVICKPCKPIKNCKPGAVVCVSANSSVCSRCKDNFRGN